MTLPELRQAIDDALWERDGSQYEDLALEWFQFKAQGVHPEYYDLFESRLGLLAKIAIQQAQEEERQSLAENFW
jgi:hypothetical protein